MEIVLDLVASIANQETTSHLASLREAVGVLFQDVFSIPRAVLIFMMLQSFLQ